MSFSPEQSPSPSSPRKPAGRTLWSRYRGWLELILTVAVAAGIAFLVQAFIVKPYRIPSGSMIPTLEESQRILVNRLDTKPGLYDVVVFRPPSGSNYQYGEQCGDPSTGMGANSQAPEAEPCAQPTSEESSATYVKRVVGLPGDTLLIKNGLVYRNGKLEKHSFITPCGDNAECSFTKTIKVPKGDYYMMGDNRGDSDDSRYWGPEPQKWIIGVAFFTYWPIDRIGTL